MRASIISVGSEILRGTLLDTNAQYFAQELHALGASVAQITQVPDELDAITEALASVCARSAVVVMSGGLGPTDDDLSREAVIALTGESPTINTTIVDEIRARFELRGDAMPQRNEKQAWQIPSARIVPNPHGTAPGWIVSHGEATVVLLPGPPRENRPMWVDEVRGSLARLMSNTAIVSRTIKTIGIGESAVADRLAHLIARGWPEIATYAKRDGVHVTVTASQPDLNAADAAVRATIAAIVDELDGWVYGYGDDSLAGAATQQLAAAAAKLALWEAGTAGVVTNMLMSDPQSAGVVADARVWNAGDTSARELARAATRESGIGIAAAVVVNISDESQKVTDGAVEIALAHAGTIIDDTANVRGAPEEIRRRAALLTAEFLWRELRSAAGLLN